MLETKSFEYFLAMQTTIYLLGEWQFNPQTHQLSQNVHDIKLDNKVSELLHYLINSPEEIITRDQLLDDLWPNQLISDDVLNVAMSSLRKALGDNAKKPEYIRTIPRKGYQLIVEAKTLSNTDKVKSSNRRSPIRYVLVSLLLVVLFVAVYLFFNQRAEQDYSKNVKIAVLPFDYYSSIGDREYIADGLTEAIINRLVQESNFLVTSRTSVMEYKTKKPKISEVSEQLNVDWVLEGSVQIENQHILVTAQLINGHNDTHVWSETYQKELTDLFAIQNDISEQIAARFNQQEAHLANDKVPPEAYDALLQAKYFSYQGKNERSIDKYQEALSVYPNYAEALAGLAHHHFLSAYGQPNKAKLAIANGSELALQAAMIKADSSDVQLVLALHYFYQLNDYAKAGQAFKTAFELNNQDLTIQEWYVQYLFATNQLQKAEQIAKHMMAVSPLAYNKLTQFYTYYYQEDYQGAANELESKKPFIPTSYYYSLNLWLALADSNTTLFAQYLPLLLEELKFKQDSIEQANKWLAEGKLSDCLVWLAESLPSLSSYDKAEILAWAGKQEEATALLDTLSDQKALSIVKINAEPSFQSLINNPKFQHVLAQLNFSSVQ